MTLNAERVDTMSEPDPLTQAAIRLRNAEKELEAAKRAHAKLLDELSPKPVFDLVADDWYKITGRGNVATISMVKQPVVEIRRGDHVRFGRWTSLDVSHPECVDAVWRVVDLEVEFRNVASSKGFRSVGLVLSKVKDGE